MKQHFFSTQGLLTVILMSGVLAPGCATGDDSATSAVSDETDAGKVGVGNGADAAEKPSSDADDDASEAPKPPAPYDYSGGKCPKLSKGTNTFFSWDGDRSVDIYVPTQLDNPGLLFAWHGLGDKKENFGKAFGAQQLANKMNVIVAVPQSKGSVTGWGWTSDNTALRDATLFDDLLHCIDKQWDIDNYRVYTTGFSAGALWSSYLVVKRSTFLAAALIWSGGTGPKAYEYKPPKRKIPVLLAWGGKDDYALIAFEDTTLNMAQNLRKDGHVVITCNHGGKHTIPFDGLSWGVKFLTAHRWDTLTKSVFSNGDLGAFPSYCSLK